jgi:hypothetical protein
MRRHKPLRGDPEKVREFLRRGRKRIERRTPLERAPLKASPGKRGDASAEGPLDPAAWRAAVFRASAGRCVVTGARARDSEDRRFHAHHPLDQAVLRRRRLFDWLWDPRNGILVSEQVHMAHTHTGGEQRIPREKLPASVWEFCAELDALEGTSWATERVKRAHPSGGDRPRDEGSR